MAAIDDLLGMVEDDHLRLALESEILTLRANKEFGLVFERHLPENIALFGYPIRRGARVQLRGDAKAPICTVDSVKGDDITIVNSEGQKETRSRTDLVVIKSFGESIFPGLKSVGRLEHGGSKPFHCVINGENFHALELLLYTSEGKVDALYLDPPYNSGAKDWTYNNNYVDTSDQYRHSKWLSFMERRLLLARKLLKQDAVMVVTIDEHEVTRLGVLLGQLFPDADVTLVTIVINPKGVTRPGVRRFSRVEEYAYFCFFGDAGLASWGDDLLTLGANDLEKTAEQFGEDKRPRWKGLLRSGTNARRADRKNLFFPVLIDESRKAVVGAGEPLEFSKLPDFETKVMGMTPVWPVRSDGSLGNWGIGHITLRDLIDKGYVSLGNYDSTRKTWALSYLSKEPQEQIASGILEIRSFDQVKNVVDVVYSDPDSAGRRIKTVWHRSSHDAGTGGTDVISGLVGGREFSFPKSVYAVRETLEMLTRDNPDALIVDFFGGSGTTTHAAMMLNAQDSGRRKTILVTNNEVDYEEQTALRLQGHLPGSPEWESRGIFNRATKPRITAAVTGKRADGSVIPSKLKNADGSLMRDGLKENVEFFELDYLDANEVSRGKSFEAIAPLLWLSCGTLGVRVDKQKKGYSIPANGRYGVLFQVDSWKTFVVELDSRPEITRAFIVTDSLAQFQEISSELPSGVEASMLWNDYLRNFEINRGDIR